MTFRPCCKGLFALEQMVPLLFTLSSVFLLKRLTSQLNYAKVDPAVWLFQASLMGEWVFKKASFSKMQSAQGRLSDYLVSRLLLADWGDVSQVSCGRERPK